jgi:CheY-like chemotaxis protein
METNHTRKPTILWADDDPDDLIMFREILQDLNHSYDIIEVHNGKEALDCLYNMEQASTQLCLIILDMNMPVMNGRDALAVIKSEKDFRSIPVVVFTTSSSELDRMFCRRYGVEMLTKPPEYSILTSVVQKLLSLCNTSKSQ